MIMSHANYLVAQGHEVTIQSDRIDTMYPVDARVKCVPMAWSTKIGTLLTAFKRHKGYECIIADIIPLAVLLAICNRRNLVYYAQDYDESYYNVILQKLFIRVLYWIGLRLIGIKTIAVSTGLAEIFKCRFSHEVTVVENGVDLNVFYSDPDNGLLALKENRKAILLMSRSDHRKGFDVALDVVTRLPGVTAGNIEVWTVGERCMTFSGNVVHRDFGYVGGRVLAQVMSSADLFLYPSRHEGFPLMVVEAFACGCPVVTTEAVCFARNRKNALVTPIEDVAGLTEACKTLLADADIRQVLTEQAFLFADSHRMDYTLENFARALKNFETAI